MREEILAAAEGLVEDEGIDALTVRAIAARTEWGKSTVQDVIGSREELLDVLADRAGRRLVDTLDAAIRLEDTAAARFRATAGWILASPTIAGLMFGRRRPDDVVAWSRPYIATFSDRLSAEVDSADQEAIAEALHLTHRLIASAIPLMVAEDDLTFAAGQLERCFEPFRATSRALDERRTLG